MTASIDRIDSSKGYTKDNIQWVHKNVNIMKMDQTMDQFLYICKKIVDHQAKIGGMYEKNSQNDIW